MNALAVKHAAMELRMLLRNGEQLLLAFVIPLGVLVGGMLWGGRVGIDPVTFPASVVALATWSSAFTSLAIATGFERRYGVLERLVATPLTRTDLIGGKMLATGALVGVQAVLLVIVAVALGWHPTPTPLGTLFALVCTLAGIAAFAGGGLVLGGTLKAEVTLGLANLVYLLGLAAGGLLLDQVPVLPTAALGSALRSWAVGDLNGITLPVLLAWAAALALIARKVFRWTS